MIQQPQSDSNKHENVFNKKKCYLCTACLLILWKKNFVTCRTHGVLIN